MDREHQPATASNATEATPAASAVGKSTLTGEGGGGEGGSDATIYRDLAPGGDAGASGGAAVDSALGTAGRGQPHPSGATIHTDDTASAAADELGAAAFTAGNDIFFGAGRYAPGTEQGDALMRHELAHVEQTRGLAPPTPGNYRVSDPSDDAEGAARDAETSGGDAGVAEAGTIHRKTNAEAGGAPGGAAPAATPPVDKLQEFFDALAANNAADAKTKWGTLAAADKARMRSKKVANYPSGLKSDPVESIIEVMGKDGLPIMKEVKAAFDKLTYADAILNDATHDAKYWLPALQANTLFNPWLGKLPNHAALTEPRLTKLDPWMTEAASIADTRAVFEHAYPKLKDTSYLPAYLKTAKWAADDIKRMWKSLQGKVPLAHVQTISGGFNLGTDEKLFSKSWSLLGFGWHDPSVHMIVMPKNSSTAGGGGTGHDMTGGDNSGVAVAGTAADPKLTHWDGTMLHEIGHGVGDKTDGNTFAKTHGEWKGGMSVDTWSKALFDDAAAAKALPTPPPKPVLTGPEARTFLATEIAGTKGSPPGKWKYADVVSFIKTHYKDENLTKYWDAVKTGGKEAYYVDTHNHVGDRTYVWLSRGGLNYTNYKKSISDNKVSWYSISSTVEWFAEQYAHYYRTGKAGTGMDAAAKKKLDDIDKMDATKTGGLKAPTPGGPSPGGEGAAEAPASGAGDTGEKGGAAAGAPIDNSAEAVRARITRQNFE